MFKNNYAKILSINFINCFKLDKKLNFTVVLLNSSFLKF